jgi:hypothetical protein
MSLTAKLMYFFVDKIRTAYTVVTEYTRLRLRRKEQLFEITVDFATL